MNEESTLTTFLNSRGSSNIDLTVINNQILRAAEHWEVSDQESCSDHSIIKFAIGQGSWGRSQQESQGVRYIVKGKDIDNSKETCSDYKKRGSTRQIQREGLLIWT